jgi:hypothetical protein
MLGTVSRYYIKYTNEFKKDRRSLVVQYPTHDSVGLATV